MRHESLKCYCILIVLFCFNDFVLGLTLLSIAYVISWWTKLNMYTVETNTTPHAGAEDSNRSDPFSRQC